MSETSRQRRWVLIGLGLSAVLVPLSTISEMEEPDSSVLELVLDGIELVLMVTGACGLGLVLEQLRADRHERAALSAALAGARSDGERWRQQVQNQVSGLGEAIQAQFQAWQLTPAESEVGMLMLKGLSHKEVASLRGTSEATIRQQARGVYQKSSLPNKAAFCAYFLEDLLPPAAPSTASAERLVTDA